MDTLSTITNVNIAKCLTDVLSGQTTPVSKDMIATHVDPHVPINAIYRNGKSLMGFSFEDDDDDGLNVSRF